MLLVKCIFFWRKKNICFLWFAHSNVGEAFLLMRNCTMPCLAIVVWFDFAYWIFENYWHNRNSVSPNGSCETIWNGHQKSFMPNIRGSSMDLFIRCWAQMFDPKWSSNNTNQHTHTHTHRRIHHRIEIFGQSKSNIRGL